MKQYYRTKYTSPLGAITLISDEESLCGLWFAGQKYEGTGFEEAELLDRGDEPPILRLTKEWLDRYFAKTTTELASRPMVNIKLPLRPQGTEFQQLVWHFLQQVPYGSVTTYGKLAAQVACAMGLERMSAQAVGGAVGRNPISLIIPCHRVVGCRQRLTGYAGGLERKQWLLEHERKNLLHAKLQE